MGLSEKRKAQFHELSTGQQRSLGPALAVAHDPPVLFLDEPTAGLDVASRVELHGLMWELQGTGTWEFTGTATSYGPMWGMSNMPLWQQRKRRC